jgi:hypothetical protein
MTTRMASRPTLLLAALVLAGCGFDRPAPPDHGLTLEALVAAPTGASVETFHDLRAGRWRVEVVKRWRKGVGDAEQTGRAVLDLFVETRAQDAEWESRVEVRVREAEGIAKGYVRAFDGLRFSLAHDATGRPDPSSLRFDAVAPQGARSFLRGFWPAGLFGATPWFPAGTLRQGDVWTREDLGAVALPDDVIGAEDARVLPEGGGRLESVESRDGETILVVRLETLLTVDGERRSLGGIEPVRLGIRDRGRATVRARDGLPLAWSLVEDIVIGEIVEGRTQRTELTLTVEGRTIVQPDRDR